MEDQCGNEALEYDSELKKLRFAHDIHSTSDFRPQLHDLPRP